MSAPHFFLLTEANESDGQGRWRFVVRHDSGQVLLEAEDIEPQLGGDRLALLAAVRALEALEQPSRVTLVTSNRYVSRGLTFGVEQWRSSDWSWEAYGRQVPIKHRDLWRRIDNALRYHDVQCRHWRLDRSHGLGRCSRVVGAAGEASRTRDLRCQPGPPRISGPLAGRRRWRARRGRLIRALSGTWEGLALRFAQLGTGLVRIPWFD